MTSATPRLAVRRRVPPGPPIDPYALAGNTGILYDSGDRLLVGIGSALTLPLEDGLDVPSDLGRIRAILAAIPCDDEADGIGSAVVAFGALPFDRSEPTALVVPELLYDRHANGEEWVTVVGRAFSGDPRAELTARGPSGSVSTLERHLSSPDEEEGTAGTGVQPLSSDDEFLSIVGEAIAAIERGELTKVVLARQVDVGFEQPLEVPELLDRWRAMEPNCTVFSMPTPNGQFVGASPELLVERHGDRVHSRPLAGSTGQMSDRDAADFRSSSKETLEHRLVAEAIGQALDPLCSSLDLPAEPTLVRLHNIMHLGTAIHGVLLRRATPGHPDGEVPTALDLVSALHPTPAVGGVPTDRAVDTIGKLESELRGTYAGPVGYVDGDGDGRWVVGIRAATLNGSTARLVAGVGIVHGSQPAAELAETSLKFTAVFDALAPDVPFTTAPRRLELPAIP
jgi:menaquinone-specific isochorismate synthase